MRDPVQPAPPQNTSGCEELHREKQRVARLSVGSNVLLFTGKVTAGILVGSVSIISEAIHTGIDLLAAIIAYVSVRKSAKPADSTHAFGHGKVEDLSGLIEAGLIFVAAALIINESINKLLGKSPPIAEEFLFLGIAIMGISALFNWYVSARLMDVAKKSESIALETDAWHLRTDVYTSLGVLAALVLIQSTGITLFDPFFAIAIALVILRTAWKLSRRSFGDLMDQQLPETDVTRIRQIICDHGSAYADFHGLRTRRSGPERFIEFHVTLAPSLSLQQAHDLADHLEADLMTEFPFSHVTIHMEPCGEECAACESICNLPRMR